jgi:hypothetical protein
VYQPVDRPPLVDEPASNPSMKTDRWSATSVFSSCMGTGSSSTSTTSMVMAPMSAATVGIAGKPAEIPTSSAIPGLVQLW